jgi:hypothetical protein
LPIAACSPSVSRTSTSRVSTVESGFTTYTYVDCGLRCSAAAGTSTASCSVSTSSRAFTNWLG